ncbi:FAD-dependent monooxygenase [Amycolatopsis acidiphila]|uniref:2,4-dichlorophenol 6-monooxygenase n=1 Tax=Amycolatopsis acidiphila TaxID=715473 RepID=A0A558AAE4_9PSEU|nr:FAD-dependent monooxygenase [Amycolatopsis acidiphila]TVT21240.1 2,4-dichlorophenol 6-monooxygenase [Amycolatopsis acidiphila]UIJ61257.1 FAD-dependent monooxygenase [Amycolatopsis acidiphila]GHG78555.1 2,4-dichlorophenol 6-monooxygenase [Amycolatopsis acidiphila]
MTYDADVLVVGSGPAGGSAALLLATYGVRTMLVSKYGWVANTPRAHITNQRTLEVLRDLGVEQEALAAGTPQELMGDTVLCTALTGEEIGRIRTWGTGPASLSEYASASPCGMIDLPQTYLEPILVTNAAARGAKVRFDTEFLSLEQDDDGVTARLLDRVRGDEYTVRARYLIGADGGRSLVADQLGLPIAGQSGKAGSMNIVFKADLSEHVAHRPSVLYWVMRPGAHLGGIGMGLVRMVRPWHEWLLTWGYDIDQAPPEVDDAAAREIVHDLVGDRSVDVEITSTSLWTVNHSYATEYSTGRVFCAGDAVHRHPPSNGLGSNTSVQDSYNLAWKLAMVVRGEAGPGLLETYTAERAPVGKQIVDRANLSRDQFGPIFEALGIAGGSDDEGIVAGLAACRAEDAEGVKRRQALDEAIQLKNYEFNAHGVELNQRYVSSAVLDDGSPAEEWVRDPELFHQPSTRPGAKLPHAWLVNEHGGRMSTLDLVGKGRFTLVTGVAGGAWRQAADDAGIGFVRIGSAGARDAYGDWGRLSGIDEDGCLLVRPDGYIAWRSPKLARGQADALAQAISRVLHR